MSRGHTAPETAWVTHTLPLLLTLALVACSKGSGDAPDDPTVSGLDVRPSNTSCLAPPRPEGEIALQRVFPNLSFEQPVLALQAPGNGTWWYVVEKTGRIYRFDARTPATTQKNLVLDLTGYVNPVSEGGLLSMAFHPNFPISPEIYLSYTAGNLNAGQFESRIARFTSDDEGASIDPATEQIILTVPQPYGNHNGGNIAFGADGYLYVGLGDGGSGGDPQDNAQNPNNRLGAMLRIDVRSNPYAIPPDNPFAAGGGRPEIYAFGLRNPWRWSFDRADGATLWAGDVGQGSWEEIDIIERGGNYGWRCYEGDAEYNLAGCQARDAYDFPIAVYGRDEGRSVTGGFVYRGNDIPFLQGTYVFGDFATGAIWGLSQQGGSWQRAELLENGSGLAVSSFAEDARGELFVVDYGGGGLYRLALQNGGSTSGPAALLSETGCVDPSDPRAASSGLVPYAVKTPFWSDGAIKKRFMGVPDGRRIGIATDGDFVFPPGTVLLKHFTLNGQYIETRLFVRHEDGGWAGYSYRWRGDQTDAELLDDRLEVSISGQLWHYPGRSECIVCHTTAAGSSLGLETRQLDQELRYPSTGRTANQLDTLRSIGLVSTSIPDATRSPALVAPDDPGANLSARARSYLHSNCAGCHRPGGLGRGTMDLRITTPLAQAGACDVIPTLGELGIADARLLAPGDPDRSILLARIEALDGNRMPPLGSNVVDQEGVALIREWIDSLADCQ
jgi:uncharacterized repeat protein (TIGR03806 family)